MINSAYTRSFENNKGLVSLVIKHSDLSGITIDFLVRFADNRPDLHTLTVSDSPYNVVVASYNKQFDLEVALL